MLTLVLGGARSGKSSYAQSLVAGRRAVYVATARRDSDTEMRARIERHRRDRGDGWVTVEEPLDVSSVVRRATPHDAPIVVDCITLWLSNLMEREARVPLRKQQEIILGTLRDFAEAAKHREVIAVSNEVGSGIVPSTRVGRRFRDLQGRANQLLAGEARQVVFVVAGLPLQLKPERA